MANKITETKNGVTSVLLDVSQTTATEADVAQGKVFTKQDGTQGIGTLVQQTYELWDGSYTDLGGSGSTEFTVNFYGYATMYNEYSAVITYGDKSAEVYYWHNDTDEITPTSISDETKEQELVLSFNGGSGNDIGKVLYTTDGTDPNNNENAIVLNSGDTFLPVSTVFNIPISSNIGIYIAFED